MKIKRFILSGEVDDSGINDTDALSEAARRVVLRDWSPIIFEGEEGRYYEMNNEGETHEIREAALRLRLRELARETGDPSIYSCVFGPRIADSEREGLRHVLSELLVDVLAEYSISDVRAALDEIDWPKRIKRIISPGLLEAEDIIGTTDTTDLLDRLGVLLSRRIPIGIVAFEGADGKIYVATEEVVISEATPEYASEMLSAEGGDARQPQSAEPGGERALYEVRVVKPFKETRTPCPPAGTIGEVYREDEDFLAVRFPLPMKDSEGSVWFSQGQNEDYMRLKFRRDEVERVRSD